MIRNISHQGVRSVIKKAIGLTDKQWNPIVNGTSAPYYLRAEKISNGRHKFKRVLTFRFGLVPFLDMICEHYDVFLTSWFNSFRAAGATTSNPITVGEELDAQVTAFLNYVSLRSEQLTPRIVRTVHPIPTECGGRSVNLKFFQILPPDQTPDQVSQDLGTLHGTYVAVKFTDTALHDLSVVYTGGTYAVDSSESTANTSGVLIFKVHDQVFSKFGSFGQHQLLDNRDSFLEATDPVVSFKDFYYLRGDIPHSNNESNNQMWLPLVSDMESNTSLYTQQIGNPTVTPSSIWALGNVANRKFRFLGEFDTNKISTEFVKDSLDDYELTRDITKLGKGAIYIDDSDVCYCPLTGGALECVVDYKPVVYDHAKNVRYVS